MTNIWDCVYQFISTSTSTFSWRSGRNMESYTSMEMPFNPLTPTPPVTARTFRTCFENSYFSESLENLYDFHRNRNWWISQYVQLLKWQKIGRFLGENPLWTNTQLKIDIFSLFSKWQKSLFFSWRFFPRILAFTSKSVNPVEIWS